jgi:multidrug efflux pump subunit AcrA (membrane-fusion protein)
LALKEKQVKQAQAALEVAQKRVATAAAGIEEAQAAILRAKANHKRWQREYDRIAKNATSVVDQQTRDETWNQVQAAAAGEKEADAKADSARAAFEESKALRDKARIDIDAREADRRWAAALLGYAKLTAPYAGVVTRRNINTGDFVQPPTGGKGEPLYVVERRDQVRIFVEVPEVDAIGLKDGAPARIRVQALQGQEFAGAVVRSSYSLDRTARTLLAEIDLPNPKDRLRPGMYASATITVEHPKVLTLPATAVATVGDVTQGYQTYCFFVEDGKARRTPIQVGTRDGQRVEVLKKQGRPAKPGGEGAWEAFTGDEAVVAGDVSAISDGQPITASVGK